MKTRDERLKAFEDVDLYVVTCESLSAGRSDDDVLAGSVEGGARIIQLRDKEASKAMLFSKAQRFRAQTEAAGMLLIINDHVDVALAVGADGVHLGQDDLPLSAARDLLPEQIIGISCHNLEEALEAQGKGADYVNIGPIFQTGTKTGVGNFLGPRAIREIAPQLTIPFTTMGGIKHDNIQPVLDAGARRVGVVTAVTQSPDIAAAVKDLRQIIRRARA